MNSGLLTVLPFWYCWHSDYELPFFQAKCCDTSIPLHSVWALLLGEDDIPGKAYRIKAKTLTSDKPGSNPASSLTVWLLVCPCTFLPASVSTCVKRYNDDSYVVEFLKRLKK